MTEILQFTKLICFIQLAPNLTPETTDPLTRKQHLLLTISHFQYPCVFYPQLYNHFKLTTVPTPNHLRLTLRGKELPSDLPIGIHLNHSEIEKCELELTVTVNEVPSQDGFACYFNTLKKAFVVINPINGTDYLLKRITPQEQLQLYNLFVEGKSHKLQNHHYEGKNVIIRIVIGERILERVTVANDTSLKKYIETELKIGLKMSVFGVELDSILTVKDALDYWTYNDGFVYVKVDDELE